MVKIQQSYSVLTACQECGVQGMFVMSLDVGQQPTEQDADDTIVRDGWSIEPGHGEGAGSSFYCPYCTKNRADRVANGMDKDTGKASQ